MPKTEIFIAIPTKDGSIKAACARSLCALVAHLTKHGIATSLPIADGTEIVAARNTLASRFLQHSATHMLCIDADIEFETKSVLKMLSMNLPFVGCVYPHRRDNGKFAIWNDDLPTFLVQGDAADVGGIGLGLCLIERKVFETLASVVRVTRDSGGDIYGFYDHLLDGDGMLSEDLSFCRRWRSSGGKIRALLDEPIGHIGEYTFRKSYLSHLKKLHAESSQPQNGV